MLLRPLLRAMRPRHWIKNSVVVAAPLFALVTDPAALLRVGWAVVAFSMTASAFYLINDVWDVEKDRQHPVKQHRPIAAGVVPVSVALGVAGGLLVMALAGSVVVAPWLAAVIGAYAFVQLAYNVTLKARPILDVMAVAGGFVLRALGGATAAAVPVSGWFLLCVGLLAFFLGIEKRKAELRAVGAAASSRKVLHDYTLPWLRRMESVVTSSALMAYALWTLEGADTPWMLATVPFVIYSIFRYQHLSEQGNGETPVDVLTRDPGLLGAIVAWAACVLLILLLRPTG